MSLKLQALGFFKNKKIKYYIVNEEIFFPCDVCGEKAKMNCTTTSWSCECGNKGNLGNLIVLNSKNAGHKPTRDFINPKKEKYEINYMLKKLESELGDEHKILKTIQKKFNRICKEFKI